MEQDFEKAYSNNLPSVDSEMVANFFIANADFLSAEMKNIKTVRSTREAYGDNAVGYVQLKRDGNICIIRGRVTPEHKVHKKAYSVEIVLDEESQFVISCECKDCTASAGGCKHGVAFLLWLHRRSEEPSVTSVDCYWKKSALSNVGSHKMDLQSILGKPIPSLPNKKDGYLRKLMSEASNAATGGVFSLRKSHRFEKLSLYMLSLDFKNEKADEVFSCEDFINYITLHMRQDLCYEAERATVTQSSSKDWYELRFGRITASKVYEAAKCKTTSGSLVETIMGASKPFETEATKRGKVLEDSVLAAVSKEKKIKITKCGLYLNNKFPIFGASPDGLSDEFCVEIKCPFSGKSVKNYISNGEIQPKYFYQLQLQMLFAEKKKGLFCVADPTFETTQSVNIFELKYEHEKLQEILDNAMNFWKSVVFPVFNSM